MRQPLVPRPRVIVNSDVRGVHNWDVIQRGQGASGSNVMQQHARVDRLHEQQAAVAGLASHCEFNASCNAENAQDKYYESNLGKNVTHGVLQTR
jgi:hypothetical protein